MNRQISKTEGREKGLVGKSGMSRLLRARENGITAGRTAPFGTGRTHLSREDREDIVQRVLRGEEIRL